MAAAIPGRTFPQSIAYVQCSTTSYAENEQTNRETHRYIKSHRIVSNTLTFETMNRYRRHQGWSNNRYRTRTMWGNIRWRAYTQAWQRLWRPIPMDLPELHSKGVDVEAVWMTKTQESSSRHSSGSCLSSNPSIRMLTVQRTKDKRVWESTI